MFVVSGLSSRASLLYSALVYFILVHGFECMYVDSSWNSTPSWTCILNSRTYLTTYSASSLRYQTPNQTCIFQTNTWYSHDTCSSHSLSCLNKWKLYISNYSHQKYWCIHDTFFSLTLKISFALPSKYTRIWPLCTTSTTTTLFKTVPAELLQ